jgi:PAS domain S-box-containing protein
MRDYQLALDTSSIITLTDTKGDIIKVNYKFIEISGYSEKELIGSNQNIVNSGYHSKEFFKDLWSTINSGEIWNGEIKNRKKNGRYYWAYTTIVPFLDAKGKPYQYISIRNEITDRVKAQLALKRLNKTLEKKVKQRTLDLLQSNDELKTFTYMVSHDLRTPLRAVSMFASQLEKKLKDSPDQDVIGYINYIQDGVKEMNTLISDILSFAQLRDRKVNVELHKIDHYIEHFFEENKISYPSVKSKLRMDKLPKILIDNSLFKHLISNLIGNSFKYADPDRPLQIEIKYESTPKKHRLIFIDNGKGFDAKHSENVFKPFNRLVGYSHSEGSGLGLSICSRIVQQHKGKMWAEGEEGKGAKFFIELPLSKSLKETK